MITNTHLEVPMFAPQFNDQIRRLVLTGPINDVMADYFLNQMTAFEYTDVSAPINVYINSPGGCVSSALSMLDIMTTCACPVRTVGVGMVMSAATILLAAGERGSRIITPNCRVMLHQVSTGMMGNTTELNNEIEEVRKIQGIYNNIMAKYTGKPVKQIEKDTHKDYYMNAQEAINYGLADRIMPVRKLTAPKTAAKLQKASTKK
jgi:ATP-dependent Clp protease protease subunit